MTGQEAWQLIAPMIYIPPNKERYPEAMDSMMECYVLCNVGLKLYDNWVANGRPEEWREKPNVLRTRTKAKRPE